MIADVILHGLSLALRFVDHFSGTVPEVEFPVRLSERFARPVPRPGGGAARQADGTYRFRNLAGGRARVLWRPPFARSHAGWTRWEDDPEVTLPQADPSVPIEIAIWPDAAAAAPGGATGVRGKLLGVAVPDLQIRITPQGQSFSRFTRSDGAGEFLFLPPGALATDATRRVPFTIEVSDRAGVQRVVSGGRFLPDSAGAPFAGSNFSVLPRSVPRILFELA
jgi:hypothetical protein